MGPIEEALREKFFPMIFGGENINADSCKILGHSVKHGGLGIPDPRLSAITGITRYTLPQNNGNLPLQYFGCKYLIFLLNNIYS